MYVREHVQVCVCVCSKVKADNAFNMCNSYSRMTLSSDISINESNCAGFAHDEYR